MKSRFVLLAAIFSLTIVALWVVSVRKSSEAVAFIGAGYGLLCFAFLVAQIVAFVKAHMDFDQTIEKPKFDILKLEETI